MILVQNKISHLGVILGDSLENLSMNWVGNDTGDY